MSKMKVLQVNKFYYPITGGVERVVQQIAEGLCKSIKISVLACQKKGKGQCETINGVQVRKSGSIGTFFSMPLSISFFFDFFKLSKNADIVHIHMPFPLADVALLLSGYQGKVVVWWHSDIVKQRKLLVFYRPIMERLLKRADLIMVATQGHIVNSSYLKSYVDKCVVIPFGITPHIFNKSLEYGRPMSSLSRPCSILYVGRLVYYKGCEVLIDAFAHTSGATLTIIGDGPLKPSLEAQVQNLGLRDKVKFECGASDDALVNEFENCDFFVLPSIEKSEAFGLVQIEAMAFGKPVINTKLPSGVPYVSIDGVTGLTVPPKNVQALAAAMQKLINDPELRAKYGEAALKRARSEFTMSKMLSRVLEEYNKILKNGGTCNENPTKLSTVERKGTKL